MVFYFRFPLGKNCITIFFFLVFRVKNKGKNFDVMHVKKRPINMTRAINYFTFYTKDSTTIQLFENRQECLIWQQYTFFVHQYRG